MVKSRFVVLRMKDIIRTGIFIIIGIALLVALIWFIMPSRPENDGGAMTFGNFVPGTYTSYIVLHNRPITVSVTVDEESILGIAISELEEIVEVFYPLINPTMEQISERVIHSQSTMLDAPVEVLHTSRILLDAINSALLQAQAENDTDI
ncbi:MAG: hypothetical protein FWE33_06270 [Defluviitaleaceae bacterium]|nr:hypothetical protein [Defluviitaleaceae bacterium]